MLGKLTKNAFKSNAAGIYNIYIAEGIITIVMLILLLVDWTKWGDTGVGLGLAIKCIASVALCITAAIGIIMTFVSVFSDFKRNMYGIEGHLTLSLPVRGSSLLFAKWLSGAFWVILSYLVFCLAAGGSALYIFRHSMSIVEGDAAYSSIYQVATEMIRQLCDSAGIVTPSARVLGYVVAMYAFDGGVRACSFVLLVFFAITLAHCRPFNKLGKLGAVLYFFAGTFITQTFASMITKLVKIYVVVSDTAFTFTLSEAEVKAAWQMGFGAYSMTNLYCTVVMTVAVFLVTAYLIDRKVNAE